MQDSAKMADGWATALFVLGMPTAREVAEQQALAVYFIQRDGDALVASHSTAFEPYLTGDDA